jgi:hypothetical protein
MITGFGKPLGRRLRLFSGPAASFIALVRSSYDSSQAMRPA